MNINTSNARSILLAALMVCSVFAGSIAFAGTAAATINTASVDADPAVAGASANHHIEFEVGSSNSLKEITLNYDQTDVQSVGSGNVEVMYGGESLGISDASGDGTSTLVITLQQSVSVSSGETITINSTGEAFVNPDATGDYSVNVSASDGTTEWGTATATLTIGSVGDEPAVTGGSELGSGATQTYNDSTNSHLVYQSASMNSDVTVMQGNRTLAEYTPTYESVDNGTYTYNVSIPDDFSDYDGLDVGANETAELTYKIDGNTSNESSTVKTGTFTVHNGEERAFAAAGAGTVTTAESSGFSVPSLSDLNPFGNNSDTESTEEVRPARASTTTNLTDNTSTIVFSGTETDLGDALAETTSDASEGSLVWSAPLATGDSDYMPVFYESASSDDHAWLDTDNDTYAVINADGSGYTVHNADQFGAGQVELTATGMDNLGMLTAAGMLQDHGASRLTAYQTAFGASDPLGFINDPDWESLSESSAPLILFGGLLFGRRRMGA